MSEVVCLTAAKGDETCFCVCLCVYVQECNMKEVCRFCVWASLCACICVGMRATRVPCVRVCAYVCSMKEVNRRSVEEKAEHMRSMSWLAAVIGGFTMTAIVEFTYADPQAPQVSGVRPSNGPASTRVRVRALQRSAVVARRLVECLRALACDDFSDLFYKSACVIPGTRLASRGRYRDRGKMWDNDLSSPPSPPLSSAPLRPSPPLLSGHGHQLRRQLGTRGECGGRGTRRDGSTALHGVMAALHCTA